MVRRCGPVVAFMVGLLLLVGSGVAAASPKPLPLRARLLERGEFPGFTPEAPTAFKTAKAWVAGNTSLTPAQVQAQAARMTHEGFKELLSEYLDDAQGPRNGLSFVMQLGSAASARAELAAEVRSAKLTQLTFRVSTIPGAVGYGGGGGENIVFADGPFLYLTGNAWATPSTPNPKHAALIEATTKLYQRVHGHPAA